MKTDPNDPINPTNIDGAYSLTKREWFAGMALQGLLAGAGGQAIFSVHAVMIADDIIEQLNKEKHDASLL